MILVLYKNYPEGRLGCIAQGTRRLMKAREWVRMVPSVSCFLPPASMCPSLYRSAASMVPAVQGRKRQGRCQTDAAPRKLSPVLTSAPSVSGWLWCSRLVKMEIKETAFSCPQKPRELVQAAVLRNQGSAPIFLEVGMLQLVASPSQRSFPKKWQTPRDFSESQAICLKGPAEKS